MSWSPIAGTMTQYSTSSNTLASGYYLKFYQSGTTTAFNMATDSTGGTTLDKCQLDSSGYPTTDGTTRFIPHVNQKYKIALYLNSTDADNNATGNADWVIDAVSQVSTLSLSGGSTATLTTLKAITGQADNESIIMLGYASEGDGGGGIFFYDSASSATSNDITIVTPDSGSGRWLRIYDGDVNVMWGGGSTTAEIQAVWDAFNTVYHPNGTYPITTSLTIASGNRHIYGEDKEGVIFNQTMTDQTPGILIDNAAITNNVYMHDISFSGGDTADGAAIKAVDVDVCKFERIDVEDYSQSAANSRGFWFQGRDFITAKQIRFKDVVTGFYFDENPRASTLDADFVLLDEIFCNMSDTENGVGIDFVGSNNFNIRISNFSGNVAKYGVRVNNTSSTDSSELHITNFRCEQGAANQPTELAAHARGVLTLTANAANGETVTLGSKTYTFETTLTNVDGNVQIGVDASTSIDNLIAAINLTSGSGTKYAAATTAQPESITAIAGVGDTLNVGAGTNLAHATTETMANGSWNSSTLKLQENTGYGIYINQSNGSTLRNLTIENATFSNYINGIYARNVTQMHIRNCGANGGYGHESINVDSTVKALTIQNYQRQSTSRQTFTDLSKLQIADANGGIEVWGPTSSPPALSATTAIKHNQPFFTPGGATTVSPGLTETVEWSESAVVNDTANMAATIPASVQGFGIALAADTTGGDRASAIFSFDDSVANGTVTLLAQNNASNTSGTASSMNIYGAGNTLRIQNNLGAQTKITLKVWYTSSALS